MIFSILNGHAWSYYEEFLGHPTLYHWGAERWFRPDELAEIESHGSKRHYRLFATATGYVAGYGHITELTIERDGSGKYRFEGVGKLETSTC